MRRLAARVRRNEKLTMPNSAPPDPLVFPNPDPPKPGETIEVRPGVLWARFPLPFRLDHVNIYFIEDGDGLAVVDTGIDDAQSRAAWEALLAGPLKGRRLTRVIATHFHPDHVGLAGWLCERFGLPLAMSEAEYLIALNIRLDPQGLRSEPYRSFYRSHGLTEESTELLLGNGLQYLRMVSPPPKTFLRLIADERIKIGGREFEVMTGAGHSPEQVMLYSKADNLVLIGDQVLAKISPNVSVEAMDRREIRSAPTCARSKGSRRRCRRTCWFYLGIGCRSWACTRAPTNSSLTTRRAAWRWLRPANRGRRRSPNSCQLFSGAKSTIPTSSSSPSARRSRM
jgi:glyoxylase-like metal-dependent hydrolase (beta-lactamase superfamily II)